MHGVILHFFHLTFPFEIDDFPLKKLGLFGIHNEPMNTPKYPQNPFLIHSELNKIKNECQNQPVCLSVILLGSERFRISRKTVSGIFFKLLPSSGFSFDNKEIRQ